MGVIVSPAGQGNSADTTDDVLFVLQVPDGSLNTPGGQFELSALGKFAANANNKRVRLWVSTSPQVPGTGIVGGTMIADSGIVANNGGGWRIGCTVLKYGPFGSNTQLAVFSEIITGTLHHGAGPPTPLTLTESVPLFAVLTGASPTTGAANDVIGHLFDMDL